METREFVNGFTSWMETHHEVVDYLTRTRHTVGSMAYELNEVHGTPGLWELGETLTDEFETRHASTEWDGEFYDTIEKYMEEKENLHQQSKPEFLNQTEGK